MAAVSRISRPAIITNMIPQRLPLYDSTMLYSETLFGLLARFYRSFHAAFHGNYEILDEQTLNPKPL